MAFSKKTWKDRASEYPNRFNMTDEVGASSLVALTRANGAVSQEGDAFNATNMNDLEDRIYNAFDNINIDVLDTKEEIIANTDTGKVTGALATKGIIESLAAKVDTKYDDATGKPMWKEKGADTWNFFSNKAHYDVCGYLMNYSDPITLYPTIYDDGTYVEYITPAVTSFSVGGVNFSGTKSALTLTATRDVELYILVCNATDKVGNAKDGYTKLNSGQSLSIPLGWQKTIVYYIAIYK